MPPMFTASLAQDLNRRCSLNVSEGKDGQVVRRGDIVIQGNMGSRSGQVMAEISRRCCALFVWGSESIEFVVFVIPFGLALRICSGKSPGLITSSWAVTIKYRIRFSSSRILPGHVYATRWCMTSGDIFFSEIFAFLLSMFKKYRASNGISSFRSRNGGR